MQTVYDRLPCRGFVDLDRACVVTMEEVVDNVELFGDTPDYNAVDRVTSAGELIIADVTNGTESRISWGKTAPDEDGFYDVVIDATEITIEILTGLWLLGVIDGECPTARIAA